jgi:hypothetical protein
MHTFATMASTVPMRRGGTVKEVRSALSRPVPAQCWVLGWWREGGGVCVALRHTEDVSVCVGGIND